MLEMSRAFNNLDEAFLENRLAESSVVSAEENLRNSRLQYEKEWSYFLIIWKRRLCGSKHGRLR